MALRKFINGIIADAPLHISMFEKNYLRGRLSFQFSDVVLSNSLAGIKSYKAPVDKTYCIYNGIDMARFSNLRNADELKKEIGIDKFGFIAGMVGAFHDRKDFITFAAAAIKLAKQHSDMCFLLIGEGKNRQSVEDMVPAELKDNIRFLGRRSDVEALIQTLDVGVLCTNSDLHGEGVSNSIIEYMSLARPVLATEGGGTNEVVEDGENGFLLKHNDVDMLVEKLLFLYNNPAVSKEMGKKALATIHKKFMLDRMAEEFISVYKGEKLTNRLYK